MTLEKRPTLVGRLLACVFAAMVIASGRAQPSANTVSDVAVVGNVNVSREAILAGVQTRPGAPFSREVASRDVNTIRDMAYFQRVSYRDESTPSGVRVIFEVVENPRITAINFEGNTLFTDEELAPIVAGQVGFVFNERTFGKTLDRIQTLYTDEGFVAMVEATRSEQIKPDGVLTITVQEVTVEAYRVTGNKKTKTRVIMREVRTPVGGPFNRVKLQEDMGRIVNQGLVEPQTYRLEPGSSPDKVIVVIEVVDKKTGNIELGGGYSSQQGLVGRVAVTEPNLKGTGQAVSASVEVGGTYGVADSPPISYQLSYANPYIDNHRTSASVSFYNRTSVRFSNTPVGASSGSGDASENRRGIALVLGRPIASYTTASVTFRNDKIHASSPVNTLIQDIAPTAPVDSNVTSVGLSALKDTRDNRFDPSRGMFISLGAETGYTELGGDAALLNFLNEGDIKGWFLKPAGEIRNYYGLKPRKSLTQSVPVLAWRFKAGTTTGPVAFFDQYFVGGADTLRGYAEDQFWGKQMLLFNLEYRHPVADSVQGVAFFDVGSAWGSSLRGDPMRYANYLDWSKNDEDSNGDGVRDPNPGPYTIYDAYEYRFPQQSSMELHPSIGLGIRVKTPLGPLRLDYGISEWDSVTHFSIAQAF